jgi:hypothetical protein
MKPAWDKLTKDYADHASILIADVDCTADGKDLCEEHGVQGFPTIKYGDPSGLEDYEGGRGFDEMKKFAEENLKPSCSPANIDLCDDAMKKKIGEFEAMSADALNTEIEKTEAEIKTAESDFEKAVEDLQAQYEKLSEAKDAKVKEVKASGLSIMKAVRAKNKGASEL